MKDRNKELELDEDVLRGIGEIAQTTVVTVGEILRWLGEGKQAKKGRVRWLDNSLRRLKHAGRIEWRNGWLPVIPTKGDAEPEPEPAVVVADGAASQDKAVVAEVEQLDHPVEK